MTVDKRHKLTAVEIPWKEISDRLDLPGLHIFDDRESPEAKKLLKAARAIRAMVWECSDNSGHYLKSLVSEHKKTRNIRHAGIHLLVGILSKDPTIELLPSALQVDACAREIDSEWEQTLAGIDPDKQELFCANAESWASFFAEAQANPSTDEVLATQLFIIRKQRKFPEIAWTRKDLLSRERTRHILEIGSRFATRLSGDSRRAYESHLLEYANGQLDIPVNGSAIAEIRFQNRCCMPGLTGVPRNSAVIALLETAATFVSETEGRSGTNIHPKAGYSATFDNNGKLISVGPGLWRLSIYGEQYVVTCEQWENAVVMSANEFGRSRGSANAILRDVGISVDSPPGHWRAVWEEHGLRNLLLHAAERVDPKVRYAQFEKWMRGLASSAPTLNRPASDGSPTRLNDGAVAAAPSWLADEAVVAGIVLPHERDEIEAKLRRLARNAGTNRRMPSKKQCWLVVIDAEPSSGENLLINKGLGDQD